MKHPGGTVSVKQNTNRLISSTEADWSHLREGTFVMIGHDRAIYHVGKPEEIMYIKDFEKDIDDYKIRVKGGTEINLMQDDSIKISSKEYELMTVYSIESAGKNFKAGDIVEAESGVAAENKVDGIKQRAALKVTSVNSVGGVVMFDIISRGKYIKPPEKISVFSRTGKEITVNAEWREREERKIDEREIAFVEHRDNDTVLHLRYPLPKGVTKGKFSAQKWVAWLTTNYASGTKFQESYEVIRDFTPRLNLPLPPTNHSNPEIIYAKALARLDEHIGKLIDRVEELEKRRD